MNAPYDQDDPRRRAAPTASRAVGGAGASISALPSDPADPPDTRVDAGRCRPFEVRAASVRGADHRRAGAPRRDDYALLIGEQWLIAAVAAGAGDGPWSHHAATISCRSAAALTAEALESGADPARLDWHPIVEATAQRILEHGSRMLTRHGAAGVGSQEIAAAMSATLLVAIVGRRPLPDGASPVHVLGFGGTAALVLDTRRRWQLLTPQADAGSRVAPERALPHVPRAPMVANGSWLGAGEALLVVTGGVSRPLTRGGEDVGRALGSVWQRPPRPLDLAAQLEFPGPGAAEDRTVVGIWAPPPRPPRTAHADRARGHG